MSSSTHALFWASSGLRGLIQLPKTWLEYGSDRQGLILNTLLKLLSLCNELDQIVLRQITDSISCIAILMISDWNTMFDDLFSACQVTSVETLQGKLFISYIPPTFRWFVCLYSTFFFFSLFLSFLLLLFGFYFIFLFINRGGRLYSSSDVIEHYWRYR